LTDRCSTTLHLGLVRAAAHGERGGQDERRGITFDRLARAEDARARRVEVVDARERRVELCRVRGSEARRSLRTEATDHDGRARPLHRLGQARRVLHRVVRAGERERLALGHTPQTGDDRELLLEHVEALTGRRERDAERGVLAIEPPGAQPELDASAFRVSLGCVRVELRSSRAAPSARRAARRWRVPRRVSTRRRRERQRARRHSQRTK
jgi:hypothetical protein